MFLLKNFVQVFLILKTLVFLQLHYFCRLEKNTGLILTSNKTSSYMRKFTFFLFLAILAGGGELNKVFAQRASIPQNSTSGSRVYYLVQNASTKAYLFHDDNSSRLWARTSIETYSPALSSRVYPIDGYLFYFDAAEGGVKIGNKAVGEGQYLTNASAAANDLGTFNATGSVWAFERSTLNATGLMVRNGASGTNYWCHDRAAGYNYVKLETAGSEDKDYYIWRFISIDDLKEEAEANGVESSVYESFDGSDPAHFKTLVEAIASAKSASSVPTIADGEYLLINRRHNLYLDGNGTALKGVGSPTQDAVWTLSTTGGVRTLVNKTQDISIRVTDNSGHAATADPTASFSLDPAVTQSFSIRLTKSSDGDARFVTLYHSVANRYGTTHNLYVALETPDADINARSTQGYSSDWGFVTVDDYLDESGLLAQDITELPTYVTDAAAISEDCFYRLQNVARSYTYHDDDNPGFGGWLEDVDHQHIRADLGNTNAELAEVQAAAGSSEFYCADKDMSHASALWQFVVISHAALGSEEATGVLATEHNIYVLRNANTGKYIKQGFNEVGGKSYHQVTALKSEAQPFYLSELADGEFALWEYTYTDSEGYDHNNGAMAIDGSGTGYRAGLTRSTTATVNTASSWHILPAPQIRLNFVNRAENNNTNDNWTTFYYPFDAVPQAADAEEVEIYAGAWIKDDVQIAMVRMDDVPAGNAVMVRSAAAGNYFLNIYPAGSGQCTQTDDDFDGSCWRGLVESDGLQYNGLSARYDSEWRNYWILGTNRAGDVRLLHPAGDWLLPNRSYLDAVTTQSTPSSVSMFVYMFDDRVTSVRDALQLIANGEASDARDGLYDLQGRRIEGAPRQGVYIRGGKKIYVR